MDSFDNFNASLTSPAEAGEVIVPDDAATLGHVTRALFVGGSGDVALRMKSGTEVTLVGVQSGTLYPIRIDKVLATGTTATNLVGLR